MKLLMCIKFKILPLVFGLIWFNGLFAQILKGELFGLKDSLPIPFATILVVDSFENILTGTGSNNEGVFKIQIPAGASYLRIIGLQLVEVQIINLNFKTLDTIDVGIIPMVQTSTLIQIQFKDISKRKNKRKQRKLINSYNKKISQYDNLTVEINNKCIEMKAISKSSKNSERLRLVYLIDFDELIN